MRVRSAIAALAGLLLLAPAAHARGVEASDWSADGGAQVRGERLSIDVPNTISATLEVRVLRELSFRFGEGCPLEAEVSLDGRSVGSFVVSERESRRELPVRADPGAHALSVKLTPRVGCDRGRAVLASSALREWVPIGSDLASNYMQGDREYRDLIAANLDSITAGSDFQWSEVEPHRGEFEFPPADRVVDFGEREGLLVRGHPLVWRNFLPLWLREGDWTRDEAIELLRNHVQTVVGRYRGRVAEWDVVNEPIGPNGGLRQNFFMREIGRQYIGLALRFAHEADPEAKLYVNDYLTEVRNRKSDDMLALVTELQRLGIPLDGVGFQFHAGTDGWPEADDATANFRRFAELGLEVQVSEMDVPDRTEHPGSDERRDRQAQAFEAAARACRRVSACTRFTTWGLSDRYSWLGANKQPLPFDRKLRPKPAWQSITDTLRPK